VAQSIIFLWRSDHNSEPGFVVRIQEFLKDFFTKFFGGVEHALQTID